MLFRLGNCKMQKWQEVNLMIRLYVIKRANILKYSQVEVVENIKNDSKVRCCIYCNMSWNVIEEFDKKTHDFELHREAIKNLLP